MSKGKHNLTREFEAYSSQGEDMNTTTIRLHPTGHEVEVDHSIGEVVMTDDYGAVHQ